MIEASTTAVQTRRPELLWVGSGAWVACDPSAGATDPHRVVAYVECKDERVYVLSADGAAGVCEFGSLRDALDHIGQRLAAATL
ncbi:hypothetical protein ACFC1I_17000 [Microbacterium sp. NPDC056044]|uniref:hypothetical protein n=1 Tax=Microbacterium sp. NPDC056044 TaxID=3345690 RepID=UPI0035D555FE